MNRQNKYWIAILKKSALFVLVAMLLQTSAGCSLLPEDMVETLPGLTSEVTTSGTEAEIVANPLLISEIMSTNKSTLQTADQNTPDWIEIRNAGKTPINLDGYCLSDKLKKPNAWKFPSVVIEPGEYLVVYASGLEATEQSDAAKEIHADFRLNSDGDEVIFSSPTGQVLARLVIPALPADISYGLLDSASSATEPYYYFGEPTPGSANGPDGKSTPEEATPHPQFDLVINEYMTQNLSWKDADGDLPDWIEICNTGTEPISLLGFWLSDDADQPDQWKFPDVTIGPGSFLVVWLSGKDKAYDPAVPNSLQASFKLGMDDSELLLCDSKGRLVIRQKIESLPPNVSQGRKNGDLTTWLYYPKATPGQPNTTAGFSEIQGAITLKNRGLWINEAVAQMSTVTAAGKVSQPDWIELYNGTGEAISLDGYGLSDNAAEPFRMKISGQTIQSGQYLVIEPVGFGLNVSSETIYLTAPDQSLADWFETGSLSNGLSSGRGNSNGNESCDTRYFYTVPTKGKANASQGFQTAALDPAIVVVSQDDGQQVNGLYISGAVQITLNSQQKDAVIRYTLDGSQPDSNSAVYQEPLTLNKNTVISCRAEIKGSLPSKAVTRTLLADEPHDLPVVSLAIKPSYFTDPAQGLWVNYTADIEQMAAINYYETDGTPGVDFNAGVALHGSYSRKESQKSLELNLRECYGDDQVIYPFFPGNEVSTFKRLILRTSGQDWKFTKLRDAFMTEVIQADMELDTMDWRPCVLYVNGEYYGLYEIRENVDEYYMAAHYGTDPDNVDIIKGNWIMLSGTKNAYKELLTYVKEHDMKNNEAYQHVLSLIDENSLMDFVIAESFFNNLDSGNKKFWRENKDGAQWRWVFFDLDWAMFPTTYTKNILKYDLLDPEGHGQQNIFDSTLQVKLMENPAFKEAFIERYAWFINNTFATERMLKILDSMTEQIKGEMPRQIARWGKPSTVAAWERNVSSLRQIVSEKRGLMQLILQESFNLSNSRMHALFPEDF